MTAPHAPDQCCLFGSQTDDIGHDLDDILHGCAGCCQRGLQILVNLLGLDSEII